MTKSDFISKIENGRDILFDVAGQSFTILTWPEEGIAIGEQNRPEVPIKYFPTAEALVENFLVHGIPLQDLVKNLVITEYT